MIIVTQQGDKQRVGSNVCSQEQAKSQVTYCSQEQAKGALKEKPGEELKASLVLIPMVSAASGIHCKHKCVRMGDLPYSKQKRQGLGRRQYSPEHRIQWWMILSHQRDADMYNLFRFMICQMERLRGLIVRPWQSPSKEIAVRKLRKLSTTVLESAEEQNNTYLEQSNLQSIISYDKSDYYPCGAHSGCNKRSCRFTSGEYKG